MSCLYASTPGASSQRQSGQRHLCICSHASSIFASAARLCGSVTVASLHQQLGLAVQSQRRLAIKSSATAPLPATNLIRRRRVLRFGYQSGAPGPDLLTRSFGVRPFIAPIHISARLPCCHLGAAAQTDANLSAHLHRLPTPPPYLRRMRLSPGRWRRFLIGDMAAVWLGCCSSNSPRARILVLGTSGAHWPARWPQFELTERVTKS